MIVALLRAIVSKLCRAWRRTFALGLPDPSPIDAPAGRSPQLEELFRAATSLRAEDGLIPMSALRSLSAEDRATVQRLSQAEARKMVRTWASASGIVERSDRGTTATEVTEPYRRTK